MASQNLTLRRINTIRAKRGEAPLTRQTVQRYLGGGRGYETGPPQTFQRDLQKLFK
jgi:hypothetical protein